MAQWLVFFSWVAIILGLLTAIVIAVDVLAHPQKMKIMNVVWPITGLYLPVIGCWLYAVMGRPMSVAAHSTPSDWLATLDQNISFRRIHAAPAT